MTGVQKRIAALGAIAILATSFFAPYRVGAHSELASIAHGGYSQHNDSPPLRSPFRRMGRGDDLRRGRWARSFSMRLASIPQPLVTSPIITCHLISLCVVSRLLSSSLG